MPRQKMLDRLPRACLRCAQREDERGRLLPVTVESEIERETSAEGGTVVRVARFRCATCRQTWSIEWHPPLWIDG